MNPKSLLIALPLVALLAGCQTGGTTAPLNAVDLHNTKCVVTGDEVGDSKLSAVYEGKVYHFCCDECPPAFQKDPAKYAKAVAADPAKYGVKAGG